jgi:hypothetical protein
LGVRGEPADGKRTKGNSDRCEIQKYIYMYENITMKPSKNCLNERRRRGVVENE